jgi:opacity protein-like surface antigen
MSYTHQAGPVALTAGYIEYLFPTTAAGGVEGTRELYLDISGAPADGFSVGLTSYYDFDEVDDFYLNPYIGYGMELMPKLSMSLRAGAGYAGEDFAAAYGGVDSGFFDYTLSAGLTYAAMDNVSLSGRVAYTDSIDDDVLVEQDTNFYGGIGMAVTF